MNKKDFTALIEVSGGMDSVYCLWKFLKENPKEYVLAHHIILKYKGPRREKEEKLACDNIVKWLRTHGLNNFEYNESVFEYGNLLRPILDVQVVAFFSGIIFKDIAFSNIKTLIIPLRKNEYVKRETKIKLILNSLEISPLPEILLPILNSNRREMADKMPADLLALVNSCRRPINGRPCKLCPPCKEWIEAGLLKIK